MGHGSADLVPKSDSRRAFDGRRSRSAPGPAWLDPGVVAEGQPHGRALDAEV